MEPNNATFLIKINGKKVKAGFTTSPEHTDFTDRIMLTFECPFGIKVCFPRWALNTAHGVYFTEFAGRVTCYTQN